MLKFSANVGFLWDDLPLPDRIRAAGLAGFDAVECHFPYDVSSAQVNAALAESGLRMLGINTQLGVNGLDDFGVAARPGREAEAKECIDEAIAYATAIGCANVNVVPGATGRSAGSEDVFRANLTYACERAAKVGITILIEPINQRSAPGFHLSYLEQAQDTVEAVGMGNLKIMFDCFHTQIMQGDLLTRISEHLDLIGHIQISAVHDRGEPDAGEIDYSYIFEGLDDLGYNGYVGAEYKARNGVEEGLGWMHSYRSAQASKN